jgi:hypothetical protein
MCPTRLGRVQTRWAILMFPALLAAILSIVTDKPGWIVLIGIYFVLGVVLDIAFYPFTISWQPPWLTFVIAVFELALLYIIAQWLGVGLTPAEAIIFYWVVWVIAISTKIVVLPIISLSWIENGGEFRSTDWSVRSDYEPLPITVFTQDATERPPALAREFSSVHEVPHDVRNLPSPSGLHTVPQVQR